MKSMKLSSVACVFLAVFLARNASAWPDDDWTGLANNGLWTDAGNWTAGVPTDVMNSVRLDAANGWSVITIPPGAVVNATTNSQYGTIFGPEWGATLNIYGSLSYNWMLAPVQNNPAPGVRSVINLFTNSSLTTDGAGLGIGNAWWWYWGAPYVTMNMYGNAQARVPNLALGGHLNIYDTATMNATIAVFTGNTAALSDGTAALVLGGGTLILPTGWTNETTQPGNTVYDLINRGVIRAYGKGYDTNDLIITDDGTNTIVASAPLGGALQRVYFQPLLKSRVMAGSFQQVTLVGDYPSVSGVLLSSAEPGIDPATLPGAPTYTSSNPQVATIDTNGLLRAVAPGTTTLTASVGPLTSTNSVTLSVTSSDGATLVHEYRFDETSGPLVADSVTGDSAWMGVLVGGANLSGGQVVLDGSSGYVQLPGAILSNMDEITIELWGSFASTLPTNSALFAFGNTDTGNTGLAGNYVGVYAHNANGVASVEMGQGMPTSVEIHRGAAASPLDGLSHAQVVAVFRPSAGSESLYVNGVLVANSGLVFNNLTDPVAFVGPTYQSGSLLRYTLGADPLNYIGLSDSSGDTPLAGSIDEFRIYDGALSAAQIKADSALGPNQFIGNATNVSLAVALSGANATITWPTNSALVDLASSPTLGPAAAWTSVAGTLAISGGNYTITISPTNSTQFFRLQ